MIYRVSKPVNELKGLIHLTSSKSESNRVLIIRSLCRQPFVIDNLASAKDTQTLSGILAHSFDHPGNSRAFSEKSMPVPGIDVGAAGTAMRFLTALLAVTPGTRILTGSERMKQRPIGILVDALRKLGASIGYMEKDGYPPLKIEGRMLTGGSLEIDGTISSQYISALLLIAPTLNNGLELHLKGEVTSVPYIRMTLGVMERFGINYSWKNNVISIPQQEYVWANSTPYHIEADWSAASYYYSMAALADDVDLAIKGLERNSLQGDSVLTDLYTFFGVHTEFIEGGIHLLKGEKSVKEFAFDFSNCPDLAQTVAVTAAALGIPAQLNGLHTLRIKETDRIAALQNELEKIGVKTKATDNSLTIIPGSSFRVPGSAIMTYDDHRMAMAFAPLALLSGIEIEDPNVVEKSYPGFWDDLRSLGFEITSLS